jgi:hypothetical protein
MVLLEQFEHAWQSKRYMSTIMFSRNLKLTTILFMEFHYAYNF